MHYLPSLLRGMRTKAVPIGVIIILGLVLLIPNNMLVPNIAKAVTCVSSGGSTDCTSVAKPSSCTAAFNAHGSSSGNARTGAGSCSMGGAVIASGSSTDLMTHDRIYDGK
jgi:hypothetical protein